MTCYIVSFSANTEASRIKIIEALKGFGRYCPINKNTWAILSEDKALQVTNKIIPGLTKDDFIFVIRSGTEAAWYNTFGQKNDAWLKENL